jgi:hypothetical protein
VEREAPDLMLLDQAPGGPHSRPPLRRVDAGEGNQYVRVCRRRFGNLSVGEGRRAGGGLGVHSEHDTCHVPFPVVRGDLGSFLVRGEQFG